MILIEACGFEFALAISTAGVSPIEYIQIQG